MKNVIRVFLYLVKFHWFATMTTKFDHRVSGGSTVAEF